MDFSMKEEKEELRKKYKKVFLIKNLCFGVAYIMYVNSITYVIPFLKLILILCKLDIYVIEIVGMVFECFFTSLPLLSLVMGDIEMKNISREIRNLSETKKIVQKGNSLDNEITAKKEEIQEAIDVFSKLSRKEQIAILNEMKEKRNLEQIANVVMADYLQDMYEDIIDYSGDKKNEGYTRKRIKKD